MSKVIDCTLDSTPESALDGVNLFLAKYPRACPARASMARQAAQRMDEMTGSLGPVAQVIKEIRALLSEIEALTPVVDTETLADYERELVDVG